MLFAIGNSVGVALNPGADYLINRHDYGLVLADNVQVVAQITDAHFLHEAYAIQMKRAAGTCIRRCGAVGKGTARLVGMVTKAAPKAARLHGDEGLTQRGSHDHQRGRVDAVAPEGAVHRHGHGAAAADQHERHDGDQDQRRGGSEGLHG